MKFFSLLLLLFKQTVYIAAAIQVWACQLQPFAFRWLLQVEGNLEVKARHTHGTGQASRATTNVHACGSVVYRNFDSGCNKNKLGNYERVDMLPWWYPRQSPRNPRAPYRRALLPAVKTDSQRMASECTTTLLGFGSAGQGQGLWVE